MVAISLGDVVMWGRGTCIGDSARISSHSPSSTAYLFSLPLKIFFTFRSLWFEKFFRRIPRLPDISHNDIVLEQSTLALSFTLILEDRGLGSTLPICCIARIESAAVCHPATATSTEAVYSQAPLVMERREIRILVLAPGTGNDVLRGELIVESLDYDDLHYTALSYTWSGSVGEHFISIGGVPLYITENLSMALRRIRAPTRPRNMWVDAISINQDDHAEKAVQVNMMGDIFASATRTIVWLGGKSADSDVAMDSIGSLQQETLDQPCDDKITDQKIWRAIKNLMQREWWTRIWVVQEALRSRRIHVQCGEKRVDIEQFVKLVKAKESRINQPEQSELPSENPFENILSDWYVLKNQVEASGLSLQALISLTHGFRASIWRDRVFALLGLATPEARSYVTPDYSDEVPDRLILIRLTMYFLRKSVRPLRFALHSRATDCPSWVVDWTAISSSLEPRVKPRLVDMPVPGHTFQAAEDYPQFEPPFEKLTGYEEPLALLVPGHLIDRVQIAVQTPYLDYSISADLKTRAKSIKTKLREWELRVTELFELAWLRTDDRPDDRPSQFSKRKIIEKLQSRTALKDPVAETKAWLIFHLLRVHKSSFGSLRLQALKRYLHGGIFPAIRRYHYDELIREVISNYEAWMQCFPSIEPLEQRSQDICKLCEHSCEGGEKGLCAHCVMGQKICRNNAGRTMFITEYGCLQSVPFAAQEGDIICRLLSCDSMFVMRKAGEIYWTLVGTLAPPDGTLELDYDDSGRYIDREPTTFRLR